MLTYGDPPCELIQIYPIFMTLNLIIEHHISYLS